MPNHLPIYLSIHRLSIYRSIAYPSIAYNPSIAYLSIAYLSTSQVGHEHLQSCGLAAAANHSTTPNARLDRNPELQSLRRHFSGGPQQALPPVPVLLARRRIESGDEITWTYPPEFIRRLQSVGAW